jgi:hypothetical protein
VGAAPPDFEAFFEGTLRARLRGLEPLRKALLGRYLAVFAAAAASGAASAWYCRVPFSESGVLAMTFFVPFLVVGLALGFLLTGRQREFVRLYKRDVIGALVDFLGAGLMYRPDERVPQGTFMRSGIVQRSLDRYSGDDLVSGNVGATALAFSEVHAEYKTESTDKDGHKTEHWHTLFRGLFLQADFNKHFKGRTWVFTDLAERMLGRLGKSLQSWSGPGQLVSLEDPEFEKEFAVYATDQQEARYVLSPALMSRVLELRRKSEKAIQLSFVDSSLFVAIPYQGELFEPSVFTDLEDPALTRSYYEALRLALSIVDELNLNTRIWTKA